MVWICIEWTNAKNKKTAAINFNVLVSKIIEAKCRDI